MPTFEYKALDGRGRERSGVLEGVSARQVRADLRDQGLAPVAVTESGARRQAGGHAAGPRLSTGERALIFRQLATLLRSGQPLDAALAAIARQSPRRRLQRVVLGLRARITEGRALAESMREFPAAFPELYPAIVEVGERAGQLDGAAARLAAFAERRKGANERVMLALLYPVLLTLVAVAIVIGLLTYVVPQVIDVFSDLGEDLPALTRGLLALSDFLEAWGGVLGGASAFAVLGAVVALRRPALRYRLDALVLRLPGIGYLARAAAAARFTETLGILLDSGVGLMDALPVVQRVIDNLAVRRAVGEAAARVREGTSLASALGERGILPPVTLQLVASGEAGGDLARMLETAAADQRRELDALATATMAVLEPLLILVMGGVVLLIVLAVLLPVFELNQLVR